MKKGRSKKGRPPTPRSGTRARAEREWQGMTLSGIRRLIRKADPEVVEEVKWRKPTNPAGVPVWSHAGIICTGETYKSHVRLTFPSGASLKDPAGVFNSGFDGKSLRALVLREGDTVNETAFIALVREAVALNKSLSPS